MMTLLDTEQSYVESLRTLIQVTHLNTTTHLEVVTMMLFTVDSLILLIHLWSNN